MCKVYTDLGGIKQLYHVCPPLRKIIHPLKLVEYLHVQVDNPWYIYYLSTKRTANTLVRLGVCTGWSESSLGTHIMLVLSCYGSFPVVVDQDLHCNKDCAEVSFVFSC